MNTYIRSYMYTCIAVRKTKSYTCVHIRAYVCMYVYNICTYARICTHVLQCEKQCRALAARRMELLVNGLAFDKTKDGDGQVKLFRDNLYIRACVHTHIHTRTIG